METFLFEVEDVFQLEGRGCSIIPGIPLDSDARVKIGDTLRLEFPDGREIETHVAGIEMIHAPRPHPFPLLLPSCISNSEVPIGTKVFHCSPKSPASA